MNPPRVCPCGRPTVTRYDDHCARCIRRAKPATRPMAGSVPVAGGGGGGRLGKRDRKFWVAPGELQPFF